MRLDHVIKAQCLFCQVTVLLQFVHKYIIAINGQWSRQIRNQYEVRCLENITVQKKPARRTINYTNVIIILYFFQHYSYQFVIREIDSRHFGCMVHKLVGKKSVITDHVDLVTLGRMDHVIDGNVFFEQAAMSMVIAILPAEEKTTASLRIEVPEQNAHASLSKKAGKIYGCGGFSNASLDIVYGNFFQRILRSFFKS